jgi:hypothetical protein
MARRAPAAEAALVEEKASQLEAAISQMTVILESCLANPMLPEPLRRRVSDTVRRSGQRLIEAAGRRTG